MNRDLMDPGNIVFNEDYPELYGSVPGPAAGAENDSVHSGSSRSHNVGVVREDFGKDIPHAVVHEYDYISLDLAYGEVEEEEVVKEEEKEEEEEEEEEEEREEEEEERDEEELVEREVEEEKKSGGGDLVKEDSHQISSAAGTWTSVHTSPLFELQNLSCIESSVVKLRATRSARCLSAFAITTSLALATLSLLLSLLVGFVLREPATADSCSCNNTKQNARDDLLSALDDLQRANERLEEELERLERSRVSVEELRGNLSNFHEEEVGALNHTVHNHARREKNHKGSPSQPQGVNSPLCERMNESTSWRMHEKIKESYCWKMCEQTNGSDCLRMCEQMNANNCWSVCERMNKSGCLRMCEIRNQSCGWNRPESANSSSSHWTDSECVLHPLNSTNSCLLGTYLLLGRQPLLENYPLLERYPLRYRISCCRLAAEGGSVGAQDNHSSAMTCGMAVTQCRCVCSQRMN